MEARFTAGTPCDPVYLRPTTKLEPLICRWPAWPHLLGPAAYAMNLAYRHIPTLESFISNPAVHVQANKNPAMLGGPFVCLDEADRDRAKELLQTMKDSGRNLLAFARDYRQLNDRLQSQARGSNLDTFHQAVPESLRGVIELAYDLNNHPQIKVIEQLLYAQMPELRDLEEICLHSTADTQRTFFMSTPVLERAGRLFVKRRFDDEALQRLAAMRLAPRPLADVIADLAIEERDVPAFAEFFTPVALSRKEPSYFDNDVRLRYFGHASVLLQTADVSVLIDPWTAWERDSQLASLTFADLPDFIDYVVITHAHADHFVSETVMQLRDRIGTLVLPHNNVGSLADPSLKSMAQRFGFRNIVHVDPFDAIALPGGGEILSLPFPGEHAGLDIATKHCVAVRLRARSFLFLVDSDAVDPALYRHLSARLGDIDAMFIGMECHGAPLSWLYAPLFSKPINRRDDEARRLNGSNFERASGILQQVNCRNVYIYAMGQEPWLRRIMGLSYEPGSIQLTESDKLIELCRSQGIPAERLNGCMERIF